MFNDYSITLHTLFCTTFTGAAHSDSETYEIRLYVSALEWLICVWHKFTHTATNTRRIRIALALAARMRGTPPNSMRSAHDTFVFVCVCLQRRWMDGCGACKCLAVRTHTHTHSQVFHTKTHIYIYRHCDGALRCVTALRRFSALACANSFVRSEAQTRLHSRMNRSFARHTCMSMPCSASDFGLAAALQIEENVFAFNEYSIGETSTSFVYRQRHTHCIVQLAFERLRLHAYAENPGRKINVFINICANHVRDELRRLRPPMQYV